MGGGVHRRDKEVSGKEERVGGRKMMTLFDSDRGGQRSACGIWCPETSSDHGGDGTRSWTPRD